MLAATASRACSSSSSTPDRKPAYLAPVPAARCIAGRLVDTYTVAQLSDPTFGTNDPGVTANIQRIAAGCR